MNTKQFQEGNGLPWASNLEKDIPAIEMLTQFLFLFCIFFSWLSCSELPFLTHSSTEVWMSPGKEKRQPAISDQREIFLTRICGGCE